MDSLPDWLIPLLDADTMRAVDRWAIERRGVRGLDLMERAGAGVARAVELLRADGRVAVVCGKGNNGGDGLVAARLLREAGREVTVACVAASDQLSGDARQNLERLPGDPPMLLNSSALDGAVVIVDALLGTGFSAAPRGGVAAAIEAVNASGASVVSVDVPSGVDASTGCVAGEAVRATVTVTFHAAKPGLWIMPGKAHAGEVRTIDIGIPRGAPAAAKAGLIVGGVLQGLPQRGACSTKFSSGHVVLVGGSRGLTGAPRMAAAACMRAGAGYVTACLPASLQDVFASGGPAEVITRALPDHGGALTPEGVEEVLEASGRAGALALGPGLGRDGRASEFARMLARASRAPMVLDADGLNAHAGRLDDLATRDAATVLTPHAGELGRLLELDSSQIERERLRLVRVAAQRARAVVVLKGDDTLVADAAGMVAVSPGNSPALASAGTGDVLTGVLAALLARGVDAFRAAAAGVWLHAEAGREAARRQGGIDGVVASDVIAALPAARSGATGQRWQRHGETAELAEGEHARGREA